MSKGDVRDSWHGKRTVWILDSCVDSQPAVRIFEDLCGFVRGIFRRMGSKSAVFSPKRTVSGRFWAAGNPHNLPKIRTPGPESANVVQNPHGLFRINTTRRKIHTLHRKSARPIRNPHGPLRIRRHCLRADGVAPVLLHRPAVLGARENSHTPRRPPLNLPHASSP